MLKKLGVLALGLSMFYVNDCNAAEQPYVPFALNISDYNIPFAAADIKVQGTVDYIIGSDALSINVSQTGYMINDFDETMAEITTTLDIVDFGEQISFKSYVVGDKTYISSNFLNYIIPNNLFDQEKYVALEFLTDTPIYWDLLVEIGEPDDCNNAIHYLYNELFALAFPNTIVSQGTDSNLNGSIYTDGMITQIKGTLKESENNTFSFGDNVELKAFMEITATEADVDPEFVIPYELEVVDPLLFLAADILNSPIELPNVTHEQQPAVNDTIELKDISIPMQNINGLAYIPVKLGSEALGYTLTYDEDKKTVYLVKPDKAVQLETTVIVDGTLYITFDEWVAIQ
ncbi:MAG: hypothetical protein ATN33_02385 [Epulopiscium sp. Nele67-Bin001]|nr:MAG: hypothetical protein ATN33_02385 [Epulopiscium sp. Nele67-Bin001]